MSVDRARGTTLRPSVFLGAVISVLVVAVMGLTISDPETLALSQADIDGLTTWVAIKALVGGDAERR